MWRALLGAMVVIALCCVVRTDVASADGQSTAVIKLLTEDVQVAADGNYVETRHVEVQAGNDAVAMQIGQSRISYVASLSTLEIVEAHTLKADGTTIPVDMTAIYDQQAASQPEEGMITDLREKLIIFPQFAAGDTAVYTVKITSKEPLFPGQFTYGVAFPRNFSFDEVRETITAPASMPLQVAAHEVQFDKQTSDSNIVYNFRYSAPNPTVQAVSSVSPLALMPRFSVSSFKDYAALGRAYAAATEPKIAVTPKVEALADAITAGTDDRRAQAEKLYDWVSGHIRYVAVELGKGSIVPHDADSIVANGYGDCKDHDALLRALLKAKGIDSVSVLINATNSYEMSDVPTLEDLNHVITWLPEFKLFADSTAVVAPFGVLDFAEYGKPVVFASTANPMQSTIPVLPPGLATITSKTVAKLDAQGLLSGTTTTTASGPYAIPLRLIGLAAQIVGPDTLAEKALSGMGYHNAKGEVIASSPLTLSPTYTVTGNFTASGYTAVATGKGIFAMPGGMRMLGLAGNGLMGPYDPGDLKDSDPTPCFSGHATEELSLEAPAGMKFSWIPKDVRISTPNLVFTSHWSLDADTMSVVYDFTSMIAEPLCTGAVRKQSADALKKIVNNYNAALIFAPATSSPYVSDAAAPGVQAELDRRGPGQIDQAPFAGIAATFDPMRKIDPDQQYFLVSP